MQVIVNVREGSLIVFSDTVIIGQQVGPVVLQPRSELFVKGLILGDLEIEAGASCTVHGTVIGNIKNRGTLKVYGLVNGEIINENGSVSVDANAKVLNPTLNLIVSGKHFAMNKHA